MNGPKRTRVAVIGSGFGGAIMACRLAESGKFDVQVLPPSKKDGTLGKDVLGAIGEKTRGSKDEVGQEK